MNSEEIHTAILQLGFDLEPGKRQPSYAYEHYLGKGLYLYVKRREGSKVSKQPLVIPPECLDQQSMIDQIQGLQVSWAPTKSTSYRRFSPLEGASPYGYSCDVTHAQALAALTQLLLDSPAAVLKAPEKKSNMLKPSPLNQILYGPPGTGKTYATIEKALAILKPDFLIQQPSRADMKVEFDRLLEDGRIRFCTFHQSFSYEDFVEGLRAEVNEETKQLEYRVQDGVFKELALQAKSRATLAETGLNALDLSGRRVWKMSLGNTQSNEGYIFDECIEQEEILLGYGGNQDFTNATDHAKVKQRYVELGHDPQKDSYHIQAVDTLRNKMQIGDLVVVSDGLRKFRAIGEISGDYRCKPREDGFGQSRAVKWLRVYEPSLNYTELLNKQFSQMTIYQLRAPALNKAKLSVLLSDGSDGQVHAETVANKPRVLIIDEINRGNISRIFGELITLIESSKREGAPEALQVTLPYSKSAFSVPNNLYLIGTMNTADRSLAGLDIALRRRFEFEELPPRPDLLSGKVVAGVDLQQLLLSINQRIALLLDKDHCIGHAYFIHLDQASPLEELTRVFKQNLLPLLQEYFFEDWKKIHWVLNDHRKTLDLQMVKEQQHDSSLLFGDEVQLPRNRSSWVIQDSALSQMQSFQQIYSLAGDA